MNDVLDDIPNWIHGAVYADDPAVSHFEGDVTTNNPRKQKAPTKTEKWPEKWSVKLNGKKTLSLTTTHQTENLRMCGHSLQDKTLTYLGVTFDTRFEPNQQVCSTGKQLS